MFRFIKRRKDEGSWSNYDGGGGRSNDSMWSGLKKMLKRAGLC